MLKSGQIDWKGVNWAHNDKIRSYGLERSQLVHNDEIRSNGLERIQLDT